MSDENHVAVCCANTQPAETHQAAPPPTTSRLSRRLIPAAPKATETSYRLDPAYRKGLPLLMSALGQKLTYAAHNGMSALLPIATAKADIGKPSCLFYPRKRTLTGAIGMSAKCQ